MKIVIIPVKVKGGAGSGNWGHAGRPGLVGGSSSGVSGVPSGQGIALTPGDDEMGQTLDAFMDDMTKRSTRTPTWKNADELTRSMVKQLIMHKLSQRTGIDEKTINTVIEQWAETSNNSAQSLSLQQAAAEELGTELSDWQKSNIANIGTGWKPITSRENERAIIRAMYEHTQEELAKAGFKPDDTITLYRGSGTGGKEPDFEAGQSVNYSGNAMESWSVSREIADTFAADPDHEYSAVYRMSIPVKNIIATAHTGFGCLREGEIVAADNVPGSKCYVEKVYT